MKLIKTKKKQPKFSLNVMFNNMRVFMYDSCNAAAAPAPALMQLLVFRLAYAWVWEWGIVYKRISK